MSDDNSATATVDATETSSYNHSNDLIYNTITTAVSGAIQFAHERDKGKKIAKDLDQRLKSLMDKASLAQVPAVPADDKCKSAEGVIAQYCAARKQSVFAARTAWVKAEGSAAQDFNAAVADWGLAVNQYETAIATAQGTLQSAVQDAADAIRRKMSSDSTSGNLFRHYTLEAEVASALQAYEASAAAAGNALAAAAGTLLEAFTTYAAAVATQEATRLAAHAIAEETFWQSVETARI
jgi:hypothetical protein